MAPADRNPSRRALPIPASDSATSKDEGFERTTIGPMPQAESTPAVQHDMTRRVDVSDNRGYADDWYPAAKDKKARPKDQRRTEVYKDKPDVVGAPERTIVAPLPRRHEEVEPIPDAASTSGARYAAEADARKQRRAEAEILRRSAASRREARRRDGGLSARDKIVEERGERAERAEREARADRASSRGKDARSDRDPAAEPAIEKTNPGIDPADLSAPGDERFDRAFRDERPDAPSRDARPADRRSDDRRPGPRDDGRRDDIRDDGRRGGARDDDRRADARDQRLGDRKSGHDLIHQNTAIEKAKSDGPWARLGVAIKDVSRAVASSVKTNWQILRTEGPKPLWLKAKPTVIRAWVTTRDFVMRIRNKAVHKAVKLGWIKPKPQTEYEQHGDDRLDQGRVDAWRKFHKGKTSSSYLQDDE